MSTQAPDPDQYVRENREDLVRIIRHGDSKFVRSMALAALVEYGDGPALDQLEREVERAQEVDN